MMNCSWRLRWSRWVPASERLCSPSPCTATASTVAAMLKVPMEAVRFTCPGSVGLIQKVSAL